MLVQHTSFVFCGIQVSKVFWIPSVHCNKWTEAIPQVSFRKVGLFYAPLTLSLSREKVEAVLFSPYPLALCWVRGGAMATASLYSVSALTTSLVTRLCQVLSMPHERQDRPSSLPLDSPQKSSGIGLVGSSSQEEVGGWRVLSCVGGGGSGRRVFPHLPCSFDESDFVFVQPSGAFQLLISRFLAKGNFSVNCSWIYVFVGGRGRESRVSWSPILLMSFLPRYWFLIFNWYF